jgi:N-methylhydantoinase B
VAQGKVSVEAAARDYGVVIRDGVVDAAATTTRRAALKAETPANAGHFTYNQARVEYEQVWTGANYAALADLLQTLPVHWRHFMKRKVFERIAALDPGRRRGDGSEVIEVFQAAAQEFPQLRPYLKQAAE